MFGFQPVPMGTSYTTPAPPLPPINLLPPCDIPITWGTIPDLYATPQSRSYLYLPDYITPKMYSNFEIYDGTLPEGFVLDKQHGWLYSDPVSCNAIGIYPITIGAKWPFCPENSLELSNTFNIYVDCNSNTAQWTQGLLIINASDGVQTSFNLANYVQSSTKVCTQNYDVFIEGGGWSNNGPLVTGTWYLPTTTYYGYATVYNSCQSVSATQIDIEINVS